MEETVFESMEDLQLLELAFVFPHARLFPFQNTALK